MPLYRVYHRAPDTGRILTNDYDADSPDAAIVTAKEHIAQAIHQGEDDDLTLEQVRKAVDSLFHLIRVREVNPPGDGQHRRIVR